MHPSFHDSIAFRLSHSTNQFETVRRRELSWSISDAGTLYGAILVERFRTYGSKLLDLSDHQARLLLGANELGIDVSLIPTNIEKIAQQLLDLNEDLIQRCSDVGLVFLLSPGEQSPNKELGKRPTCMLHLNQLPFAKLEKWYKHGIDLSIGTHHAVPSVCWPNQIKSRSRLPYFLSDALAAEKQVDSLAILTTMRGVISDTSVANILIVDNKGEFSSPRKEDILVGCTLKAVERILNNRNIPIHFRDIDPKELACASEVLLTGSTGGIWFARSVDGIAIGTNEDRPKLRLLTELWKEHVGIDFVSQAAN